MKGNKEPTFNVILVDDNENDLDVATEVLEKYDSINVRTFNNAEKAYSFLLHEFLPVKDSETIIFLDLNMPKKNGFELLEEIKANPNLVEIPVVMYTSSKRRDDIKKAYALGAVSYIVKPMKITEVEKVFKDIIYYWLNVAII